MSTPFATHRFYATLSLHNHAKKEGEDAVKLFFMALLWGALLTACAQESRVPEAPTPAAAPTAVPGPSGPGWALDYWLEVKEGGAGTQVLTIHWRTYKPEAERCELGSMVLREDGTQEHAPALQGQGRGTIALTIDPGTSKAGIEKLSLSINCFHESGAIGQNVQLDYPLETTPTQADKGSETFFGALFVSKS